MAGSIAHDLVEERDTAYYGTNDVLWRTMTRARARLHDGHAHDLVEERRVLRELLPRHDLRVTSAVRARRERAHVRRRRRVRDES